MKLTNLPFNVERFSAKPSCRDVSESRVAVRLTGGPEGAK